MLESITLIQNACATLAVPVTSRIYPNLATFRAMTRAANRLLMGGSFHRNHIDGSGSALNWKAIPNLKLARSCVLLADDQAPTMWPSERAGPENASPHHSGGPTSVATFLTHQKLAVHPPYSKAGASG